MALKVQRIPMGRVERRRKTDVSVAKRKLD